MTDSNSTFKDAALRAVGRTVVNFQRLERNLRCAARLAPLEGVPAKVQKDLDQRNEKTASMTLGQSIGAWLDILRGEASANRTPDLLDPTMRVTFSFEGLDPNGVHGDTLKRLLERRNDLVHDGLATFDWESPSACDRLVKDLNSLNKTIHSQITFLAAILSSSKDLLSEMVKDSIAEEGRG